MVPFSKSIIIRCNIFNARCVAKIKHIFKVDMGIVDTQK